MLPGARPGASLSVATRLTVGGPRATTADTPIGRLTIVTIELAVVATQFDEEDAAAELERLERRLGAGIRSAPRELGRVRREVDAYFAGKRRSFVTPVDLRLAGEGFARRVLEVTTRIPFGELWTYGDVAGAAGSQRAGRAAGNALGRCPIELFVPCHRVVHADGGIGGYGRHEERKRWLLRHEGHPERRPT
jgi:methylated-DNA-[protein]-cysteine S-methyltransferase